ncbi:FGGY-family carbohydrate kinase [Microbacterium lacticum]
MATLGIDIGTFESKGIVVDETGAVLASARRRHGLSRPAVGHVEQDADEVWWADLVEIARELTTAIDADEITGVAVSAIGPCVLPVDAELRPLRPAILYGIDTRAEAEIALMRERLGDEVEERSGNELTSQSAGPKVVWIARNEPDVAARTRWYLTSQSYLVARLCGRVWMDHGTAGYFHGLYDLARGAWDPSGFEDFVTAEQLPPLAWASQLAGEVTAEAAALTGLRAGTPVAVGTTDAPAEAVGCSVADDGDLMLMLGSSGYFIQVFRTPRRAQGLWTAPFVFPGTAVLAAGTSTAGTATRWAVDLLGIEGDDAAVFPELVALASDASAGADGALFLPHLAGERTPLHDPDARGVLAGLSLDTTRPALARAVIEGIAHSVAHALSIYPEPGPDRVVAVGGGTKNAVLVQSVADLLGRPLLVTESLGASYGDAGIAAVATGSATIDEVVAWSTPTATVEPGPDAALLRRDQQDYQDLAALVADWNARRAARDR